MHTRTSKFGGRDATFSIAAADASAKSKRDADYICDGVADDDQFVAAIARIAAMPSANGKIIASEGSFYVTGKTAGSIPLISNLEIEIIGKVIFTSPTPDGSKMFYGNAVHDVSIVGGALDGNASDVNQIDGYRTLVYLTGACYNITVDSSMQNVAASSAHGTEFSTKNGANVSKTSSCHSIKVTNRNFPNILQLTDLPDNHRSEELISNCSSGWSFVGAGAGYSTTKYLVDHSLYMVPSTSAYTVLSTPIDFTHRMIHFMVYIPACTRGNYAITCDLFNNVSNAYVRYTYSITTRENLFDRWIHVACRPETVGSGVVDYRVIDKIRFSNNSPGIYVGKVWSTIEPESYVVFSFDDGLSAVEGYTAVLDEHGMPGVYGINPGQVESVAGRLSWSRLADMAKIGHEIVGHGYDHLALSYDSAARCEIAGLGGQDSLVNHSFARGARFLILPYTGLISSEGYDALRDHMVFISTILGRGSVSGSQSTYWYRHGLTTGLVATIKSEIDSVFRSGGCLDLYAHAPDTYGNMSVSEFHQIVDYITQLGIPVVTYSELYDSIFRKSREFTLHTDHYFNILAASANYIRSNEDLSVATPITFTLDAQPDIPRALSWAFDSHAQITAYTMEVVGIDGQGRNITETWTESSGWSGETSNAFTSITSIKMTSRTGTGVGDTMDFGITNTIGLRKKLLSVDHLQTIKKNNVSQTIVVADTSSKYGTYDLDTIGVVDTDDIEMTYKTM